MTKGLLYICIEEEGEGPGGEFYQLCIHINFLERHIAYIKRGAIVHLTLKYIGT